MHYRLTAGTRQPLSYFGAPGVSPSGLLRCGTTLRPVLQAEELDEIGAIHIANKLGLDVVVPAHLLGDDLKVSLHGC